jgi:GTPase SAR1 family protein
MSSLNLEKIGRPLAKIIGGTLNGRIVNVSDNEKDDAPKRRFKHFDIPVGSVFQLIPNPKTERTIVYVVGCSGSGKSTFTSKYIEQYHKTFPKNPVYLFSSLDDDEVLDKVGVQRIKVDKGLIGADLTSKDFENSLVVFDDCDVLTDKKIREAVLSVSNSILEIGRHFKTSCFFLNHLPTAGKDTRRILNEAHNIVYFPHSGSAKGTNYMLTEYVGFDKEDIKMIKKMKTRWCCIYKNYPQVVMTEEDIWILADQDDTPSGSEYSDSDGTDA